MSGVHSAGTQGIKPPYKPVETDPVEVALGKPADLEVRTLEEDVTRAIEHDALFNSHNRHTAHNTHAAVDVARVAKEAPHIAAEVAEILAHNPRLDSRILNAMIDLGRYAPDLASTLLKKIVAHPTLCKPLLEAMPKIAKTYEGIMAGLKAQFPRLSEQSLARIAESSLGRGIAKAIPVVGVGIALWGSFDTAKALVDPRLSKETKAYYAMASAADWGAAIGGLLAETGIGEAAAVAAAVSSIGLFAKAEASRESDLQGAEA